MFPPKDPLDPEQVKQEKQENEKPVVVKKRGRILLYLPYQFKTST
jgi:hypothetical protein